MTTATTTTVSAPDRLRIPLAFIGAAHVALGLWMAIAPGSFYDTLGGFGARNDHYLRDVSTFYLATGVAALIAMQRPSWRLPVLALYTVQYVLHTINHIVDVSDSNDGWVGPADVASLALAAGTLAALTVMAKRDEEARA